MGNTFPSLFPPSFTTEKHEASAFPLSDLSLNLYTTGRSDGHSEDLQVCSEAVLHKFRYSDAQRGAEVPVRSIEILGGEVAPMVKANNESFHPAQQRMLCLQREEDWVEVPASYSEAVREGEDLRQYTVGSKTEAMRFPSGLLCDPRVKTGCLAKSTDIVAKDVSVSPDLFAEVVSPDSAYVKPDRHGPSVKTGEDERFRRLLKYTSTKESREDRHTLVGETPDTGGFRTRHERHSCVEYPKPLDVDESSGDKDVRIGGSISQRRSAAPHPTRILSTSGSEKTEAKCRCVRLRKRSRSAKTLAFIKTCFRRILLVVIHMFATTARPNSAVETSRDEELDNAINESLALSEDRLKPSKYKSVVRGLNQLRKYLACRR